VLTGSAIGSNLGRFFKMDQKTLMLMVGCGAAGAISGIFQAPIAGVVFTLEVLMIDLTFTSVVPLLISAVTASSPYTTTKPKPEVPFPGSKNITKYTPFSHNGLYNIQEVNGLITCEFTTTTIHSAVENIQVPRTGVWYNILGQPIDPNNYKGVAIHDNKKYLLR
jgi:hypothetical protein